MYHFFMAPAWINRAKYRMQLMGITQQALAESLGSTRGAVGHYLSGRRSPSLKQIQLIAEKLKVRPAWLLYGQGEVEVREESPGYSLIKTGNLVVPILGTTDTGPGGNIDTVVSLALPRGNYYALTVSGQDYSPRMYEGEAIIIDPDLDPAPGDEVVIKTDSTIGLFTLSKIRDQKITLNALSNQHERVVLKLSDIRLMHCIVAVVRDNCLKEAVGCRL